MLKRKPRNERVTPVPPHFPDGTLARGTAERYTWKMDKHLQPSPGTMKLSRTTQGIQGAQALGLEKSGAGSSCNEHRPFWWHFRPDPSRNISHWPSGRESVFTAPGAVCPREYSSSQTGRSAHRVCASLCDGVAGHAGRTGIRAIAFGGAGVCHKSRGDGRVGPPSEAKLDAELFDRHGSPPETSLKKSDRIFFLIGIDAFREIAQWRDARALLAECDFIVASRPGFSLRDVAESLPQELRPPSAVTRPFQKQPAKGDLVLPGVTLHLLEGVQAESIRDHNSRRSGSKQAAGKVARPARGRLHQETRTVPARNPVGTYAFLIRAASRLPAGYNQSSRMKKKNDLQHQVNEAILACQDKQAQDVSVLELEKDSERSPTTL